MNRRRHCGTATVSFFAFQDIITSVVGIFVLITLIMALELAQTVSEATAATTEIVSQDLLDSLAMLEQEVNELQADYDALIAAQGKSAGTNRFNREQQLRDAQQQLERARKRIERTLELTEETQRSLTAAKTIEQELLAQSQAAEADRQLVKNLQDKRKKIESYSAIMEIEKPIIFRDQTDQSRFVVLVRLEGSQILISDSHSRQEHVFSGFGRTRDFQAWLSSTDLRPRQILLIVKATGVEDFETLQQALDQHNAVWGFDVAASDQNYRLRFELGVTP